MSYRLIEVYKAPRFWRHVPVYYSERNSVLAVTQKSAYSAVSTTCKFTEFLEKKIEHVISAG